MSDEPTICTACKHLYVVNKTDPYWRWLCIAAPREPVFSYVVGERIVDPPYITCKQRNYGNCPDYKPGVNSLSPNLLNPNGTPKEEGDEK